MTLDLLQFVSLSIGIAVAVGGIFVAVLRVFTAAGDSRLALRSVELEDSTKLSKTAMDMLESVSQQYTAVFQQYTALRNENSELLQRLRQQGQEIIALQNSLVTIQLRLEEVLAENKRLKGA